MINSTIPNDDHFVNHNNERFRVQDNSLHNYFSQIPHIIYELGWSAYKIATYCVLKRIAGDHGQCTKSYTKLAAMSGMSYRNFKEMINQLCEIDPILKKPLINKTTRVTECGDKDTNMILINDIWPENMNFFKDEKGGRAYGAPPQAQPASPQAYGAQGVGHTVPEGRAYGAYKEEHLKNNPLKKTTTSTPSLAVAAVHKSNISEQDKLSAKQLQEWSQKEAFKTRKIKQGRHYDEYERGHDWVIPLKVFENLIHIYGIVYFQEQLDLMCETQLEHEKGKKIDPVLNPARWIKAACKNNYAESLNQK
jgi:predicted transcriptional regulator